MKIILSIKPVFVKEIFEGRKKYEYRKTIFSKQVDSVIIYSTMPEGLIVGEFSIAQIEEGTPTDLWEKTQAYSGVTKEFFDCYFKNRDTGYALKIKDVKIFKKPIDPSVVISNFIAPQSFRYVSDEDLSIWQEIVQKLK